MLAASGDQWGAAERSASPSNSRPTVRASRSYGWRAAA